jgi:hypothetical protein
MQKIKYITGFAGYVYSTLKNTDRYFTRVSVSSFRLLIAPVRQILSVSSDFTPGTGILCAPYMPAYDGKQKSQQQSQQRGAVEDPPFSNPNLPPAMIKMGPSTEQARFHNPSARDDCASKKHSIQFAMCAHFLQYWETAVSLDCLSRPNKKVPMNSERRFHC